MQRLFSQVSNLCYSFFMLPVILLALVTSIHTAAAEDKMEPLLPPPPYVTAEGLCISVGVKWDSTALAKFVPSPLKLSPDATGAINICNAKRGYVITPITYANFDVDLANSLAPDSESFVWQGFGIWAASPAVVNTAREYYGEQIHLGDARITETKTGYRATASLNGKEVVAIEVKLADKPCTPANALISYLHVRLRTGEIQRIDFPVAPDICEATPVSVKVTPLTNDSLFAALQPKEVVYAVVGKNATIGWGKPLTISWSAPAK